MEKCAIFIHDDEFGDCVVIVKSEDYELATAYLKKFYPKWKKECSGTPNHIWNHVTGIGDVCECKIEFITHVNFIDGTK